MEDKADLLCQPVFSLSCYGGASGSTWLYISHSWHLTDSLCHPAVYPMTCLPLSGPSVYCITVLIAFIHTGNLLGRYLAQPALCRKQDWMWICVGCCTGGTWLLIIFDGLKFVTSGGIVFILDQGE